MCVCVCVCEYIRVCVCVCARARVRLFPQNETQSLMSIRDFCPGRFRADRPDTGVLCDTDGQSFMVTYSKDCERIWNCPTPATKVSRFCPACILVLGLHTVCMRLVRVACMARYCCGVTRAQEATYFPLRRKSGKDLVFTSHFCCCWFTFSRMLLLGDVYWQDPLSAPESNAAFYFCF